MAKICKNYTGVSCVDGSCLIANAAEYEQRCMDVVKSCNDCPYYYGCVDCAWATTEYCKSNN